MSTAHGRPSSVRSVGRRREDHMRARLAALVDSAADAIIGVTLDGHITDWNPAAERLFGYPAVEALGQPLTLLIPPDRLAEAEAILERVRGGTSVAGVETERRTKDGRRLAVALTVSPVHNDAGELIATAAILRDLSEQAVKAAQYRTLVDQLPAVVYTEQADTAHTLLYVSPYVTTLLGFTPEAFVADPGLWMRCIHPDDQARVQAAYTRKEATGEPVHEEYRVLAQDGHRVWVSDATTPVRDAAGHLLFWQGVALDITARKVAEEALADSEARFRTAFAHAPMGMALVELDGRILQANTALCAMLGYAAAELVGMPFQQIIHPDDVAPSLALLRSLLAGERETYELEKRQFRKDGQLAWVQVRISVVRDGASAPSYLIAQVQDITERRRLTQELHASEEKYRTLVNYLPALVYVVAPDGAQTPLYFSPYLEQLTGYLPEQALGRTHHWLEAIHPDDRDRVAAADAHSLATGEPLRIEYRFRRKDGSYVWVLDESIAIRDEHGAIADIHGVLIDISDRVAAEAALAAALEEAQAATRSKGLFLAMMSHELRTPLQAVLGYADFLLRGVDGVLTAEQAEDIGAIHRGAARMVALIEQMLDLSRLEAGRLPLEAKLVDLAEMLAQVRQDVTPQVTAKELAFSIALPASLPLVLVDPDRLRQILLNLVDNAVKFTEAGSVEVTASQTADGVMVAVNDTGVGISEEAISFIFEEFRQVGGSVTRRFGGAGLGLAIAKRLAERMGGTICVASQPGVGSSFTLHLPASIIRE